MQRNWMILARLRGSRELVGDFRFGAAQDDARLTLGLRLTRHGILQRGQDLHITDLYGLNRDPPRVGLLVEQPLQFVPPR